MDFIVGASMDDIRGDTYADTYSLYELMSVILHWYNIRHKRTNQREAH